MTTDLATNLPLHPATNRRKFRSEPPYPAARAAGNRRFAVPRPFASRTKSSTTARTPSVFFGTSARSPRMCGAAPVTRASGKTRTVGFRYAANRSARVAITGFADNSRHLSAWAGDAYRRARARGARHPHAVRIVARGWIQVIWACWSTGIAYEPLKAWQRTETCRQDLT